MRCASEHPEFVSQCFAAKVTELGVMYSAWKAIWLQGLEVMEASMHKYILLCVKACSGYIACFYL
jgi:hypothetical protein